jgi:pyruvate/2-oxoglutarate dehydrogenase complex dihydrolipoamide dehydrogenase (E3) component
MRGSVTEHEFDVVVIGMGPGGEKVAGSLAQAGLSVAAVEDRLVGGECPYWGCVPSKMMVRAADLLAEGRRIPGLAGRSEVTPDWAPVARRIRAEATDDWDDKVAADRFTGQGGTLFRGVGRITGPGRVAVGAEVLRARRGIVLNTGTEPEVPDLPGLAGTPLWTNREAIEAEVVPESLVVLGGGPVAAELGQVFRRFGAAVTIVEAAGRLLPAEEPEAGDLLGEVFRDEGIDLRTGTRVGSVRHDGSGFTASLDGGGAVTAERLLVATGRRTRLDRLGVGAVGLDESARYLPGDGRLRVAPGVWAVGDITGRGAFTHVSMYQAGIVIADILGRPAHPAEYHAVPRVTFTDPEVGAVGLTEAAARQAGLAVRVAVASVAESARGWIHQGQGLIKLVEDARRGVLVGATSAGPAGGEVLAMLTLAVHAAIPVRRLSEMIYAYPAFHDAVQDAVSRLEPAD